MYETKEVTKWTFEAKGLETVRRDGCPAVAKIMEKSLQYENISFIFFSFFFTYFAKRKK